MATVSSRVVAYLPSLKTYLQRLRATTSTPSSLTSTLFSSPLLTAPPPSASLCLPEKPAEDSMMGTLNRYSNILQQPDTIAKLGLHSNLPLPGAGGLNIVPELSSSAEEDVASKETEEYDDSVVECLVQECPSFLLSGFMKLFPGVSPLTGNLTVITVSERTVHDQTAWSRDVEEEREELMENFVNSAKEICSRITGAGHWSDFIDPSSGRPYFGAYTTETLFETDDRYRYFGLDVIDLGCCRCVSHPLWGTFTFIGTIFTDAPMNSPVIHQILTL